MRIDSHHSFNDHYAVENLDSILKRNRFDGSILVCDTLQLELPEFVKAVILRTAVPGGALLDAAQQYPLFRGICTSETESLHEMEMRHIPLDFSGDLRLVPGIAEQHPSLRIVVDHLGSPPFDGWDRAIEEAARFPQVFCKLSGLMRIEPSPRPFVQFAMSVFGPQRLMFGSDWPTSLPEHGWKANLAAFTQSIGAQTMAVREEMLGDVAARFYNIPPPAR